MITEIASALLPVILVIALGYYAGRRKIIDNENVSSINSLVITFAVPASLFVAIWSGNRSGITSHLGFIVVCVVTMVVVYAVTLLLQLKVFRLGKGPAAVQALVTAFGNYASVGLPLAAALIGPLGSIAVAIGLAIGSVTISPITMALLEDASHPDAPGSTLRHLGSALGKSVRKPVVLAPVLAIVLAVSGVHLPGLIEKALNPIGVAGAGAALFLTGLLLSAQKVSFGVNVGFSVVVKNVIMPLLAWLVCTLLHLGEVETAEAILLAAIPCGFFGLAFGAQYGVLPKQSESTCAPPPPCARTSFTRSPTRSAGTTRQASFTSAAPASSSRYGPATRSPTSPRPLSPTPAPRACAPTPRNTSSSSCSGRAGNP
jgi:malonate transporter and related proteins